ncbi:armadillo-type protein [Infundibulicybe gibba]|nr:armadillo-type protein [Infundibulicybe gibba]
MDFLFNPFLSLTTTIFFNIHLFPMHSADNPPNFLSLYGPNPPRPAQRQAFRRLSGHHSRNHQTQPGPGLWTLSRALRKKRLRSNSARVFITAPAPQQLAIVGAIGDGRKKNSPDFEDNVHSSSLLLHTLNLPDFFQHVEQLLRTLNLNSPAPSAQKPPLTLNLNLSPNSPDFSPASVTSALLTPTDLSPTRSVDFKLHSQYDIPQSVPYLQQHPSLLFEHNSPIRAHENLPPLLPSYRHHSQTAYMPPSNAFLYTENFPEHPSPRSHPHQSIFRTTPLAPASQSLYSSPPNRRVEPHRLPPPDWRLPQPGQQSHSNSEWLLPEEKIGRDIPTSGSYDGSLRSSFAYQQSGASPQASSSSHEPINFLSLLHPSSSPPYHAFVSRIIKSSDQQASIFLQQKLKVADPSERAKIVDAICARGFEMMAHRFGNWAVQRCLEAAASPEERRRIGTDSRPRYQLLRLPCLQKALDCEEDIRLLIVSELLLGDPAQTLVNKHASHVWSKIMELSWTPPAPPIFAYVNKSLKGKWAALACHETGSLVVQHAFENLEAEAKDGIVDELLNHGAAAFGEVAKNQWGSYCIQHILEHGSERHRQMTLEHLLNGLLEFATSEQGSKSVTKALKEGGKETLDRVVKRMCEPAKTYEAFCSSCMIVDLALSVPGSQLIASVLPTADKDQRALLYDCIRGHIVTLRGCKTGSKVIWLFDRMRAYYGY